MVSARMLPALLIAYTLVALPAAGQEAPKTLSLKDAINTALQNNLQVQINRITLESSGYDLTRALAVYDWSLSGQAGLSRGETDEQITEERDALGRYIAKTTSTSYGRNLSLTTSKAFTWGGSFNATYSPVYRAATSKSQNFRLDPYSQWSSSGSSKTPYDGSWNMNYVQPLLRGFGKGVSDSALVIARRNGQRADLTFQQSLIQFVSDTESQYWSLVNANRALQNKKLALDLARKQLKENKIRVEVGTMAPIEVASAEAQVAREEQGIIQAEANMRNQMDAMKRLLWPGQEPTEDLTLSDSPTVTRVPMSVEEAQKLALERRVEIKAARIGLENAKTNELVAESGMKPKLDLTTTVSSNADVASALGPVNSDLSKAKNPTYSVNLSFAIPLANRSAKSTFASSRAARRKAELDLRDLELTTSLEVKQRLRDLESKEKAMFAAQKAREFSQKDMEAEQKKFDNGMSTNFIVLSKQSSLDQARANELAAQIDYANAVTAFEKVIGNLLEARQLKVQ